MNEAFGNLLYLPFGQMVAYKRATAKDLDPDYPINRDAVVKSSDM
jgi:glucosamine 6-phosphate synthetase-like amidotransferase/phosphosugar isomerase protein